MADVGGVQQYLDHITHHFETHNKTRDIRNHDAKVHSVSWSCDGRRLASGSFDKSVCVFALDRDRLLREKTFHGHTGSVDQLVWHPSHSDSLASASADKTVRIFDTRTQKSVHCITTKGENINISWSPDGNTIAVGNKEDLVSLIDARKAVVRSDQQFKYEVNEIAFNKECDQLYLTTGSGTINVVNIAENKVVNSLKGHTASCICIDFDPSGSYYAVGSADALVSIWDVSELACIRMLSRLDWPIRTLSFSYDGQLLASGSEDLVIDVALVNTGDKVAEVPCESPTLTVAWHPKKLLLAYACDDKDRDTGTIKLFGFEN